MDILDNINIGVRIFFLILNIKEDLKKLKIETRTSLNKWSAIKVNFREGR